MSQRLAADADLWKARVVCPANVVSNFAAQLGVMLESGVGIADSLALLAHQDEYPNFGVVVYEISQELEKGRTLSSSLNDFPRVFPQIFRNLVQVGESTGGLKSVLSKISSWMQKDFELVKRVKGALAYPLFVLCLSSVLTALLFYAVLPQFVGVFESLRVELPLITRVVIFLTRIATTPGAWLVALIGTVYLTLGIRKAWANPKGRWVIYSFLWEFPVVGQLLQNSSMARFSFSLSLMLETGEFLPKSLKLSCLASGNPLVQADSKDMLLAIESGQPLSEYLASKEELYPSVLRHLVAAGENSASLPKMVAKAGDFLEERARFTIENLSAIIEPILLGGVSFVVGGVLVSVFVPLYSIVGELSG